MLLFESGVLKLLVMSLTHGLPSVTDYTRTPVGFYVSFGVSVV